MIRLRALMMVAGLFAMATAAHGQSLSLQARTALCSSAAFSEMYERQSQIRREYFHKLQVAGKLQNIEIDGFLPQVERLHIQGAVLPQMPAIPTPVELAQLEVQAEQIANQPLLPPWLTQAVEQGMTTWQKLRASNGNATVTSKKLCCDDAQPGSVKGSGVTDNDQCFKDVLVKVQETRGGNLMLQGQQCTATTVLRHLVQQVPCCGIKDFVQFNLTQSTPPCCCAKGCARGETCKPKTTATLQVCPSPILPPLVAPFTRVRAGVILTPTTTKHLPMPRFETPDLEVHCEKMTHRGDMVVFEGDVMLLSKKHAQPIRVNAQRVILNLKDGSYAVESARQISLPVSSFGVLRMSSKSEHCVPPPACLTNLPMTRPDHTQHFGYEVPTRVIRVLPVPISSIGATGILAIACEPTPLSCPANVSPSLPAISQFPGYAPPTPIFSWADFVHDTTPDPMAPTPGTVIIRRLPE
jgi:hypothetical protein